MKLQNLKIHRWFALGLVFLAIATWAFGQTDFAIGSIIKKFELPQRDSDGKLRLTIYGREATVMSRNRIKVNGLKIDIYQNGETETVLTSPNSDFWRIENRLTTQDGIAVEHPNFRLTAKEMNWELEPSRGSFKKGVKLMIKNTKKEDDS
ncbi:MAG: hypothetical protein AAF558_06520 [Verrucomicrobiota bacterium]